MPGSERPDQLLIRDVFTLLAVHHQSARCLLGGGGGTNNSDWQKYYKISICNSDRIHLFFAPQNAHRSQTVGVSYKAITSLYTVEKPPAAWLARVVLLDMEYGATWYLYFWQISNNYSVLFSKIAGLTNGCQNLTHLWRDRRHLAGKRKSYGQRMVKVVFWLWIFERIPSFAVEPIEIIRPLGLSLIKVGQF